MTNNLNFKAMQPTDFTERFRAAFGKAELPLAFWYSDKATGIPERTKACFIKYLKKTREGEPMTFDTESVACGGGKFYTGFSDMPPFVPTFVSEKEKYKQTPEMVLQFIREMELLRAPKPYLNFSRVDTLDSFDRIEGLIFFATPDVLTGLVSWTQFDNNRPDSVSVPFGSGCSSIISQVVSENRRNGKRAFLGLFDPSVRPNVEANVLSLAIPLSRFKEMYETMPHCCFNDTHAWPKVRERINHDI